LALGSRYNIHSEYGSHATFSVNPSYVFDFENHSLKLMSSWSSAYIVPTLFQLFSNYGNIELTPETTKSLEFGLDYSVDKKFNFTALYFTRNENNSIQFVSDPVTWVSKYENDKSGVIKVAGFESGVSYSPISKLDLNSNYTFTKTSKERPYSIPKHKWNTKAQYKFSDKTQLLLSYQYTSDRTQMDFSSYPYTSKNLENYHILNMGLTQSLIKNKLTLNVAVDNLFNTDYVETIGFTTLGRNYSVSFKYKL
jgi:vitamin B12 transporter